MNLRKLWNDDDAVSPVIGVILMVAITVILAAVIATFVLGLGEQVSSTAPQASFSFDYTEGGGGPADIGSPPVDGNLKITHNGGETLTAGNVDIVGGDEDGNWGTDIAGGASSKVSAGDSAVVAVNSTQTVKVTWKSETGDTSATLSEWEGPDA